MTTGEIQRLTRRRTVTPLVSMLSLCAMLLLAAGVVGYQRAPEKAEERVYSVPWDPEEYQVYEAVLGSPILGRVIDAERFPGPFIVRDRTVTFSCDAEKLRKLLNSAMIVGNSETHRSLSAREEAEKSLDTTIAQDLCRKAVLQTQLMPELGSTITYRLVSEEEVEEISQPEGIKWRDFFARYPNSSGLLGFSRVGLDSSKKMAVVYIGFENRWLPKDRYAVLEHGPDGWQVTSIVVSPAF